MTDEMASGRPTDSIRELSAGKVRCHRCGTPTLAPPASCPRCANTEAPPEPGKRMPDLQKAVARGVLGVGRGFGWLGKHPRLWTWVIVPLIVNALVFVGICTLAIVYGGDWLPDLSEEWPGWIDWLRTGLGWLLTAVLWLVSILASFYATLLIAGVINAPFYDLLSEAVENSYFGSKDPGRPLRFLARDILRSLRAALSLAVRQGLVMFVLLLLSFTAIGAPLFLCAGFYYAGLSQLDIVMGRKLYPAGQRTRWARQHILLTMGLGVPVSLLPVLAPFGVVGATLAWLEDPEKGG